VVRGETKKMGKLEMREWMNKVWQTWFGKHSNWKTESTGCVISPGDKRDWQYKTTGQTFNVINLENEFRKIKNQGNYNSCSAFAICSIMEYYHGLRPNGNMYDLSEMMMWYKTRLDKESNTGAYIKTVVKESIKGCCLESQYTYTNKQWKKEPNTIAKFSSGFIKLKEYKRIKIKDIKNSISNEHPVIFGLSLKESFMNQKGTAHFTTENFTGMNRGGHALVIVGFENDFYRTRNSWGSNWRDNGHCWIHKNVLEQHGFDFFTLKPHTTS